MIINKMKERLGMLTIVIQQIIEKYGLEILLDEEKFMFAFKDLAPDMTHEYKMLKRILNESVFSRIYEIAVEKSGSRDRMLAELNTYLEEELGFSNAWAVSILAAFANALGFFDEKDKKMEEMEAAEGIQTCYDEYKKVYYANDSNGNPVELQSLISFIYKGNKYVLFLDDTSIFCAKNIDGQLLEITDQEEMDSTNDIIKKIIRNITR